MNCSSRLNFHVSFFLINFRVFLSTASFIIVDYKQRGFLHIVAFSLSSIPQHFILRQLYACATVLRLFRLRLEQFCQDLNIMRFDAN